MTYHIHTGAVVYWYWSVVLSNKWLLFLLGCFWCKRLSSSYHYHQIFLNTFHNWLQIASFIKSHIFSRRRPIDGWKYMIEELGPNAKRGKGSVQRLPSLADPATQPFKEERPAIAPNLTSNRGRR